MGKLSKSFSHKKSSWDFDNNNWMCPICSKIKTCLLQFQYIYLGGRKDVYRNPFRRIMMFMALRRQRVSLLTLISYRLGLQLGFVIKNSRNRVLEAAASKGSEIKNSRSAFCPHLSWTSSQITPLFPFAQPPPLVTRANVLPYHTVGEGSFRIKRVESCCFPSLLQPKSSLPYS